MFPKRKPDRARAVSWQSSVRISNIARLVRVLFAPHVAGSTAVDTQQLVVLFQFYFANFCGHAFRMGQ